MQYLADHELTRILRRLDTQRLTMAEIISPKELRYLATVHELCLCEHDKVIPQPGVLYRFTVDQGCRGCLKLAEAYEEEQ